MKIKFKVFFTLFLTGFLITSCEKTTLEELTPADTPNKVQTTASSDLSTSSLNGIITTTNLLFEETFEKSTILSGITKQFATDHAFDIISSPVYRGTKAAKFELRDTDPMTSGGTRTELLFPEQENRERWYAFAAYFPSRSYPYDSNAEIINQWHQGTSPATSLRIEEGRMYMRIGNTKESRKDYDLGPLVKSTWTEFVFHIIHSYGTDGLIEVWINGNKVLTHNGGNMYNTDLPRWKVGIYKDAWNNSRTTDTKVRAYYIDNIRIGNENSQLNEMRPSITSNLIETIQKVNGFTVVSAESEKDIRTISNGSVLSLSTLGTSKLNFRANIATILGGSVKLELTGKQSHTYIDNAAPYALFGDDGNGNYYHGNWKPLPGSYTLKATTFSELKATGIEGNSYSVSFRITE